MSADNELYVVPIREDRQKQIETMDIGDTVSIARRIDLTFGIDPEKLTQHTKQVRGILDTQAHRARRKSKAREYTVENGSFLTKSGALLIVCTVTRIS